MVNPKSWPHDNKLPRNSLFSWCNRHCSSKSFVSHY